MTDFIIKKLTYGLSSHTGLAVVGTQGAKTWFRAVVTVTRRGVPNSLFGSRLSKSIFGNRGKWNSLAQRTLSVGVASHHTRLRSLRYSLL
jgi:hypothetical protein